MASELSPKLIIDNAFFSPEDSGKISCGDAYAVTRHFKGRLFCILYFFSVYL